MFVQLSVWGRLRWLTRRCHVRCCLVILSYEEWLNSSTDTERMAHIPARLAWKTIGIGGRTVDKMIKKDMKAMRGIAPNRVIFYLRSNDLCQERGDLDRITLSLVAFVDILLKDLQLTSIVWCQVNDRVQHLNVSLKESIADIPHVKFWRHRGLNNPSQNIFARDGIHLNDMGHKVLCRSYRGAIMLALNSKGNVGVV